MRWAAVGSIGLLALLALGASTGDASTDPPPFQLPGTKRMAERLARMAEESDPTVNYMYSHKRAELILAEIKKTTNPKELLELRPRYANELLNAGRTQEAIDELLSVQAFVRDHGMDLGPRNRAYMRHSLGISYLRLGEQENCLTNHTTESCIVPIRAGGVHKLPRGSRSAIAAFTEQLTEFPDDLKSRWLLNIAYMTLGEYPDGVPAKWLIDPTVFASEGEIKRFTDVAGPLGLDVDDLAGGAIVEDFDNDGYLDVMVSSSRLTGQLRFFRNQGDGAFQDRTEPAGLTGEIGGLNLVSTDYNNDGLMDAFVLRGGWLESAGRMPRSLLRNNGDGTFEDVTEEAGLLGFHPTQTADWLDYDGDGLLDVYIGNESRGDEVHPCELYRNNGDGTFTDVAQQSGVANIGYVKGVVSGDYDNDGRPDLYLSRKGQPNVLYHNDGPTGRDADGRPAYRFTDVAASAKVTEPIQSFPTWFFDYDNDGWEDLFVAGYAIRNVGDVAADYLGLQHPGERCRLFRNERDGTFSDVTRESGLYRVLLAMGSNFGDIDNDGWLDFYLGTGDPHLPTLVPNRLFRNDAGKRFLDVTTSGGVGHLQKGHGVSFADIDNDGDQDIYEDMGGAFWGDNYRNVLYENQGYGNHWITLELHGVRSNRPAVGARIAVVVDTRDGERTIHRTAGTGGSFGVNPSRQEIGLGEALSVKSVEIAWPAGGPKQILRSLAMDRFYAVLEGAETALRLPRKSFRFAVDRAPAPSHHHE